VVSVINKSDCRNGVASAPCQQQRDYNQPTKLSAHSPPSATEEEIGSRVRRLQGISFYTGVTTFGIYALVALLVMRRVNGETMKQGDDAATDEQKVLIRATKDSEVLLFDLA